MNVSTVECNVRQFPRGKAATILVTVGNDQPQTDKPFLPQIEDVLALLK